MSHNVLCYEHKTAVGAAASRITLLHTHKHMHAPKHAHCNTYGFVWIEQVSSSVLALLSGSKQQCSVDAFRHNSSTSDGPPNSPSQFNKRLQKPIWPVCARLLQISAERLERTHPLSPLQYLSGCGAHRPASTAATPEIKIMSDLKLWWPHPRSSSTGADCHVCLPLGSPFTQSIRPERTSKYAHASEIGGVRLSECHIWRATETETNGFANCAADASAAARYSSRRCSLLVRLCVRTPGWDTGRCW